MTTHGEFLHRALRDADWRFFEKVQSYPEFLQDHTNVSLDATAASQAAARVVDAIKRDYQRAELDPANRAILDFTRKLAVARRELGPSDYQALRTQGLSEHQILDIILVASLAEFANCLADGIGMLPGESLRMILFGNK
jgi:alkylhydroperoxidase family enzyme